MRKQFVLTVLLCVGYAFAGCGPENAPRPDISGQAAGTNADYDILDIVLRDLIGNKEFDPAVGGSAVGKSQVVLDDFTFGGVSDELLSHLTTDPAKAIPSEPRADLVRRNRKGKRYSLKNYRPADSRIRRSDLSRVDLDVGFPNEFPAARGYVLPYLPGYSRDGRSAVFFLRFGPASHGAFGYYLLKRVAAHWEIVCSDFAYR
jgi:hypothetical protein